MIALHFHRNRVAAIAPRLFILTLFVMVPLVARGATYYVAKNGSASKTCLQAESQQTPKLTIASGISCLAGGDTLVIGDGTYNERIYSTIPSGNSVTPTTIRAQNPNRAVIKPTSATYY